MEFFLADSSHINMLVKARRSYLLTDFDEVPESVVTALPAYFEKHLNKELFAFLCTVNGELVGSAFLLVTEKPPSPAFPTGKVGSVLNVYTAPEHRRKGVAKTLMGMLLDEGRSMRLDHIELKATEDGYPLYKSLGFADEHSHYRDMRYYFDKK